MCYIVNLVTITCIRYDYRRQPTDSIVHVRNRHYKLKVAILRKLPNSFNFPSINDNNFCCSVLHM